MTTHPFGGDVEESLPATIGRFVVLGELGRGGMGRVLLARDPDLGRDVAVKLLRDDVFGDTSHRIGRFLAEGRIASGLDHPSIVPVHELGWTTDRQPFLVMRRVEGRPLREVLRAGHSRQRLLGELVQVCQAVGHAHGRGIVHRDLKPENVMIGPRGEVYVVDWGIAALRGAAVPGGTTQDGTMLGTLGYMAPEAVEGDVARVGPRSDVFSLGAMLYEILTGRAPFDGDDPYLATLTGRYVPVAEAAPGVDADLADLCRRALAPLPADRFADAAEVGDALQSWLDGATRRARADERVADGRVALRGWQEGRALLRLDADEIARAERAVAPWLPLDHPDKVALRAARRRRDARSVVLAEDFADVESAGEAALALDPGHAGAHALLADALWLRLVASEEEGDAAEVAYAANRLRAHDDGSRAARLAAPGYVSLVTEPDGAEVIARRYLEDDIVWPLGEPLALGRTPLREVALPPGSWILLVDAPGRRTTRYPVRIERGGHWAVHADRPLRLLSDHEIGAGWIYVPEGPYRSGGDPEVSFPRPAEDRWVPGFLIREHAVTAEEYAAWLYHLSASGQDWASHAPRVPAGAGGAGGRMWSGEPPYSFPLQDPDGDVWEARWPICGISHEDAQVFAGWARAELPTEDEFEKAARGVDGRRYPWGRDFDAGACKNVETRRSRARPEVVQCVPGDRSPYGVSDLAGVMRTWCRDPAFNGDPGLRPVRGGHWGGGQRICRPANRYGIEPVAVQANIGARHTRRLPGPMLGGEG